MPKQSCENVANGVFWEKNIDIVTTFLATNGQIQVALVTAYSTAIAFLTTWGSALQPEIRSLVFGTVVPVFSLAILVLSINVYSWICLQLKYLDDATVFEVKEFCSYFEFRRRLNTKWAAIPLSKRLVLSLIQGVWYYITMPFKIRDIYCYYFLIYIVAPIVSLVYVTSGKTLLYSIVSLVAAQIVLVTYGLRDRFALQFKMQLKDDQDDN